VLRLRGTIRSVVLDLVGTSGIFTDEAATVPASVGQAVAAWRDESRPTMIATQGTAGFRPTATADGLTFDGGDDRLFGSVPMRDLTRNISAITIYLAALLTNATTGRTILNWSTPANAGVFRLTLDFNSSSQFRAIVRRADAEELPTFVTSTVLTLGVARIYAATIDYGNREIRLYENGVQRGLSTNPLFTSGLTDDTTGAIVEIGSYNNSGWWLGDIRRIQAYHAAHSPATVAAITAELAAQHGVTL
jgi:FlaG/FlaF family flagellin (archaellin)